jgi:hypothetical protein
MSVARRQIDWRRAQSGRSALAVRHLRVEAALMAAIFIATYSYEGAWASILICVAGLAVAERAARTRPVAAEPAPA